MRKKMRSVAFKTRVLVVKTNSSNLHLPPKKILYQVTRKYLIKQM